MSIQKALFEYMGTKPGISNQVGDRVYPDIAPESAVYPFITVTIINEDHTHHMGGAAGLAKPTAQIDVWAKTINERELSAEAVRVAMDGFRGNMGDDNISVRSCFLQDKTNFQEPDAEAKGTPIYRSSMDFSIWHVESVPTL